MCCHYRLRHCLCPVLPLPSWLRYCLAVLRYAEDDDFDEDEEDEAAQAATEDDSKNVHGVAVETADGEAGEAAAASPISPIKRTNENAMMRYRENAGRALS